MVLYSDAAIYRCTNNKFTQEQPCRSLISIKLLRSFIEIALRHGCLLVLTFKIAQDQLPQDYSTGSIYVLMPLMSLINWGFGLLGISIYLSDFCWLIWKFPCQLFSVRCPLKGHTMQNERWFYIYRSSHRRCSVRKRVLRNFTKFTGNTCARVSFLLKLQACNFIKKETLA